LIHCIAAVVEEAVVVVGFGVAEAEFFFALGFLEDGEGLYS
jgi:hypothetical protein